MAYNPTVAKELALVFLEKIGQRATPSVMKRTITQVKELMEFGYTDDEIKYTIDYVTRVNKNIYSFGYVCSAIDSAIKQRDKGERPKHAIKVRDVVVTNESEVETLDELAERNKRKASGFGVQSRKRKKYNFDMFEGQ